MEKGTRERTFGLLGRRSTEHELTGVSYHNGHTGTILLVCWHSRDALHYLVSTNYTTKDDMLAYEVKTDKGELVGDRGECMRTVQMGAFTEGNEELGVVSIWAFIRHA